MNLKELMKNAVKLKTMSDCADELQEIHKNGMAPGISTGWRGFDQYFMLKKGHLNVLSGTPGSGKSEWLESMAVQLAAYEKFHVFIYGPENYPLSFQIIKLVEKVIGKPFREIGAHDGMNDSELFQAQSFLSDNFTFADAGDRPYTLDELLFTIENLKKLNGKRADMVIIDPWNELEGFRPKGMSETDWIGDCLMRCRRFARQQDLSFWIVCHPAKPQKKKDGTYPDISLYDLHGSSHWYNKCDNGIILKRENPEDRLDLFVKASVKKIKNRFYGRPGEHYFEFQPWSGRYIDNKPKEGAVQI